MPGSGRAGEQRAGRAAEGILYALLALIVFPVFPHFVSPNEFTRWALAAAMVEDHSLEITRFVTMLGGANFEDVSEVGGRLYSNKAPGATLIGLPGYALARAFVGRPSAANMRITLSAMRIAAATIPLLILAFFYPRPGALLFATPLFAYGLLNFSHALSAAALFLAWQHLFANPRPRNDVIAGALIGLSVLSEYPMAVAGAVLMICALPRAHRIIAGGLPFAALLAAYNYAAFGSVFALSSGAERNAAFRQMAGSGVFGIGLPDIGTLVRLLFDPSRGLFLFSPILLLALAGVGEARRVFPRAGFVSLIVVPLSLIVLYSGYPNWHGGWSVGPRYLVPAIPFLLMPLAYVRAPRVEAFLLGVSTVAVAGITLTFPFPDLSFRLPWATLGWPLLRDGLIAPNALHLVSRPLAIIVPFAIVVTALMVAARDRLWAAIGIAVVIAISATYLYLQPLNMTQRLRVGFIKEVYFEQRGAMQREVGGAPLPPRAIARAEHEKTLPPTSWPF